VLIKIELKNENRKSKSGLFLVGDSDFNPAENAQRVGRVVWIPRYLNYKEMEAYADMDLQVGDKIWFDYMTGLNCVRYDVDNVEYKFMNYSDLYVADRDGEKILLNGFCLFELVDDEIDSPLALKTGRKDSRYGICKYAGKPNKKYVSDVWVDDERIVEGVKVIFGMPPILLEDSLHEEFAEGSKLRISQRRYVLGFEQEGEVYPTKGCLLIKPDEAVSVNELGLEIPVKYRKKSTFGEVLRVEGSSEISVGDRVHFYPSSATYIDDDSLCLLRQNSVTYKL